MKFLRVGNLGKEIVATLDSDQNIRDLSSYIKDLNPDTINFENLKNLQKIKLNTLPNSEVVVIKVPSVVAPSVKVVIVDEESKKELISSSCAHNAKFLLYSYKTSQVSW